MVARLCGRGPSPRLCRPFPLEMTYWWRSLWGRFPHTVPSGRPCLLCEGRRFAPWRLPRSVSTAAPASGVRAAVRPPRPPRSVLRALGGPVMAGAVVEPRVASERPCWRRPFPPPLCSVRSPPPRCPRLSAVSSFVTFSLRVSLFSHAVLIRGRSSAKRGGSDASRAARGHSGRRLPAAG